MLTLSGVVIGVGALVMLVSAALGLKQYLRQSFESDDVLRSVTVTKVRGAKGKRPRLGVLGAMGQIVQISEEEIEAIRSIDGVAEAYPDLILALPCRIPLRRELEGERHVWADFVPLTGSPESQKPWLRSLLLRGRMWEPGEEGCVIPRSIIETRFGLRVEDIDLERPLVITMKKAKKDGSGESEDLQLRVTGIIDSERLGLKRGQIHIPLATALAVWRRTKGGFLGVFMFQKGKYPAIMVKTKTPGDVSRVKEALKEQGYEALSTGDILETLDTTFMVFEAFMGAVGAIGLLVALFGIANTMAMAVLERTREIGILKALGAQKRDIRRLFLIEAGWVGMIGGFIGLGLGWCLGAGLNAGVQQLVPELERASLFYITPWLAVAALVLSTLVSLVAGLIPAMRASRMDPVAALRLE